MLNKVSRIASLALGFAIVMVTAVPAQAAFPAKYHPGHYMLTWFGTKDPHKEFDRIKYQPQFVGVEKRYTWKDLEPSRGRYDFSKIASDLAYLKAMPTPKRLIIEITTDNTNANSPALAPGYLLTAEFDGGVFRPRYRGTTTRLKRWNAYVQIRLIALFRALGQRFDKDPYLEGVVLDETATGIRTDEWRSAHYLAERQYTGIKRIMSGLKSAFPNTMCIQYINFFSGATAQDGYNKLAGLMDYAFRIGMGFGEPDVHVGGTEPTYDYHLRYSGSLPLASAVQYEDYGWKNPHSGRRATVSDILGFARSRMHLNYIFWLQKEPEFSRDVIPLTRRAGAP